MRTSDRNGKFNNQDCWNRDIVEGLICNAIIAVRCNITETNAMKDSRMGKRMLLSQTEGMKIILRNWDIGIVRRHLGKTTNM